MNADLTLIGTVMLWDHRSRQVVGQHQNKGPVKALQFVPDGSKLVLCTENGDLKTLHADGSIFQSYRLEDSPRCLTTDGRRVIVGTEAPFAVYLLVVQMLRVNPPTGTMAGYASIMQLPSGSELIRYSASKVRAVNCVAATPDGSRLVAGCEDSCLHIWSS